MPVPASPRSVVFSRTVHAVCAQLFLVAVEPSLVGVPRVYLFCTVDVGAAVSTGVPASSACVQSYWVDGQERDGWAMESLR